MRDRYSILVGLIFLALVIVAVVKGVGGGHTLGLEDKPPRWPLPEFAVPAAAGPLEGDANVAQDDCATAELPARGAPAAPPPARCARAARSASATSSTGPR